MELPPCGNTLSPISLSLNSQRLAGGKRHHTIWIHYKFMHYRFPASLNNFATQQLLPVASTLLASALLALILLAFCGVSSAADADSKVSESRPNLLFLLADDLRYDALAAHGNPIVQTPNLDRLAEQATSFNRAFVTTSICMISRASIMTGQHACRHGIHHFGRQLSEQQLQNTYFSRLKEHGYRVGFVGKWGVGAPPRDLFDFDAAYNGQGSYYGPPTDANMHLTQYLSEQAAEFISGQDAKHPFCLSISFKAPHVDDGNHQNPFNFDRALADVYEDVTIPQPRLNSQEFFDAMPHFLRESENRIRWRQRFATEKLYQRSVKGYYRLVTGIDRATGQLLSQLKQQNLLENTVVIFTSDHGFYLGERGFAGKWYPHDLSLRIPLLIRDYRATQERAPHRSDALALNIDLAPTMLDYAGAAIPESMQGRSLRGWVEGEKPTDWPEEFYYSHPFEYATIPKSEAIRTPQLKYIVYPETESKYEELYDLRNDPDEQHNLAQDASWQEELEQCRERLVQLKQQACEPRVAKNSSK